MPTNVRVGAGRYSNPLQSFQNTRSSYGDTVGSSVGYDPANPYGFMATRSAKAYPSKVQKVSGNDLPGKSP